MTHSSETHPRGWDVRARMQLAGVGLLVVGLAAGATVLYQQGLDRREIVSVIRGLGVHPWVPLGYLGAYFLLTTLFAPSTLLHLLCGAAWGFERAVLLNLLAANLTCNVQFWGARALGRAYLRPLLHRAGLDELDARAARNGLLAVLFARLVPLPMVVVNAAVAVSTVRWRDFAVGSFVATLPMVCAYTYFAAALVEGASTSQHQALVHSLIGALLLGAITLAVQGLRRRMRQESGAVSRNPP